MKQLFVLTIFYIFFLYSYQSKTQEKSSPLLLHMFVDDSKEKRPGDEALNASSLQFFRSIKRFIAAIF
jgi:hypothetical protein